MGYLDDINIFSNSEEVHIKHLRDIFQLLKDAGLQLKLEHSQDAYTKNSKRGEPTLGLVGYYIKFVPR